MVICKEDGPLDDLNQVDGGAWIVANNYPDDLASSVLLCSFANGSLDDQNQIVFATIVAVLAFFNRLEQEKQRSEFRSEICTVYLV